MLPFAMKYDPHRDRFNATRPRWRAESSTQSQTSPRPSPPYWGDLPAYDFTLYSSASNSRSPTPSSDPFSDLFSVPSTTLSTPPGTETRDSITDGPFWSQLKYKLRRKISIKNKNYPEKQELSTTTSSSSTSTSSKQKKQTLEEKYPHSPHEPVLSRKLSDAEKTRHASELRNMHNRQEMRSKQLKRSLTDPAVRAKERIKRDAKEARLRRTREVELDVAHHLDLWASRNRVDEDEKIRAWKMSRERMNGMKKERGTRIEDEMGVRRDEGDEGDDDDEGWKFGEGEVMCFRPSRSWD